MRKGNLFILLLAIAMGGIAAFLARNWIAAQANVTPVVGTIVVAALPVAFGTELNGDNVTEIPWASGQMPEGAFATRQQLFKDGRRVALAPIQKNELILRTKVTGPGQLSHDLGRPEEGVALDALAQTQDRARRRQPRRHRRQRRTQVDGGDGADEQLGVRRGRVQVGRQFDLGRDRHAGQVGHALAPAQQFGRGVRARHPDPDPVLLLLREQQGDR